MMGTKQIQLQKFIKSEFDTYSTDKSNKLSEDLLIT